MMRWILIKLVRGYQYFLSPWLGSNCRFNPTCSEYTIQSIKQHGAIKGSWLGIRRIGRCHPWAKGGDDPVPPTSRNKQ
ncbi:membrane protein insertion efficiency factor YidD [Orrella daihaiensis]|uniref:Putative membrane protein insertion efficiency factor n=1 Tax=Orrella daihaiensis TaxID=2782176 RepID=A0ABY4AKP9_9BURK|nr:membrane protein insertion efficiency factor YidD [Orrella daihaiensis]UOD50538.1 membrane protein insertion efficiency factor YidD [Orrella daihaiensis]